MYTLTTALYFGVIANAPVPAMKPRRCVELRRVDDVKSSLLSGYFSIDILNNSDDAIEVKALVPDPTVCLDAIVLNDSDKRLTEPYAWSALRSAQWVQPRIVATIKPQSKTNWQFNHWAGIDRSAVKNGKYKCQVTFKSGNVELTSNIVEFEVTEVDRHVYMESIKTR